MDDIGSQLLTPRIVERPRGGVMALSDAALPIRIGVIADSPEIARQRFADLVTAWLRDRAAELAASSRH